MKQILKIGTDLKNAVDSVFIVMECSRILWIFWNFIFLIEYPFLFIYLTFKFDGIGPDNTPTFFLIYQYVFYFLFFIRILIFGFFKEKYIDPKVETFVCN